ncbi:histidine phosphatase family protein [Geminicoccaceae bacterium 1502E]|nr:histidine phosphatase family protein [Geminicoccaceae bacterium 1502E]
MRPPAILLITHPEVVIDPAVPVPDWPLSPLGRARTALFAVEPALAGVTRIVSSAERKARDTAAILAQALGLTAEVEPALHENDRSATGFLPPDEFERVADAFFARPEESVRGWERAVDAQARVVEAVRRIDRGTPPGGSLAVVAHGGVGALLMAHAMAAPVSRRLDQPGAGGGNWFLLERGSLALRAGWQAMPRP